MCLQCHYVPSSAFTHSQGTLGAMSGTLQRLVVKGRQRMLSDTGAQQKSASALAQTVAVRSPVRFIDTASPPLTPPTPLEFPFPSIHHFNVALGDAVRHHRSRDIAALEDLLAPHYHNDLKEGLTVASSDDHTVVLSSSSTVSPSVETFQLLMAGRLHAGDWEGALRYFEGSQQELLPVTDTTLRMALRAYQHADSPHTTWRSALQLFRSFQHRVSSADTAEIMFDLLMEGGCSEQILQLYREVRGVVPLDASTLAVVVEAANGRGEWILAMQLASTVVTTTTNAAAVQSIVASSLAAALHSNKYLYVQECIQKLLRNNTDLLNEASCLVGAKAAAVTQHVPTVLRVLDFLKRSNRTLHDGISTFHAAQNIALVSLHNAVVRAATIVVANDDDSATTRNDRRVQALFDAARAVQAVRYDNDVESNGDAARVSNWVDALRNLRRTRNADALTLLNTVSIMREHAQWRAAVNVLVHVAAEYNQKVASTNMSKTARGKQQFPVSPVTVWAVQEVVRSIPLDDNGGISLGIFAAMFLHRAVEQAWLPRSVCKQLLDSHSNDRTPWRGAAAAAWLVEAVESPAHIQAISALELVISRTSSAQDAGAALVMLMEAYVLVPPNERTSSISSLGAFVEAEVCQVLAAPEASQLPVLQSIREQLEVSMLMHTTYPNWLLERNRPVDAIRLLCDLSRSAWQDDGHRACLAPFDDVVGVIMKISVETVLISQPELTPSIRSALPILGQAIVHGIVRCANPRAAAKLADILEWLETLLARLSHATVEFWCDVTSRIACSLKSLVSGSTTDVSRALTVVLRCTRHTFGGADVNDHHKHLHQWILACLDAGCLKLWLAHSCYTGVLSWIGKALALPRSGVDCVTAFLSAATSMASPSEEALFVCVSMYLSAVNDACASPEQRKMFLALLSMWIRVVSDSGDGARRCTDVLVTERVMAILALRHRAGSAVEWLIAAHHYVGCSPALESKPSGAVLRSVLRVLRSWLSEGRQVHHDDAVALLAIPTSPAEFTEAWAFVQASFVPPTTSKEVLWANNAKSILEALRVFSIVPHRCWSVVQLYQALAEGGAAVLRNAEVYTAIMRTFVCPQQATSQQCIPTPVVDKDGDSFWKLILLVPHSTAVGWGVEFMLRSAPFRALLAAASCHRPHSLRRVLHDTLAALRERHRAGELVAVDEVAASDVTSMIALFETKSLWCDPTLLEWLSNMPKVECTTPADRAIQTILSAIAKQVSLDLATTATACVGISDRGLSTLARHTNALLSNSSIAYPDITMDIVSFCWWTLNVARSGVLIADPHPRHDVALWCAMERMWLQRSLQLQSVVESFADPVVLIRITSSIINTIAPWDRVVQKSRLRLSGAAAKARERTSLVHHVLNVVLDGANVAKTLTNNDSRAAVIRISAAMGRWRQLAEIFTRWAAAAPVATQPQEELAPMLPVELRHWYPLICTAAAAWSTNNNIVQDPLFTSLSQAVRLDASDAADAVSEDTLRRVVRAAHAAAVAKAHSAGGGSVFDPIAAALAAAIAAHRSSKHATTSVANHHGGWKRAVALVLKSGIKSDSDAVDLLGRITTGCNGHITPFHLLCGLKGAHIPSRVPLVLVAQAVATCPTWSDGVALVRHSVASIRGAPLSVQRYVAQQVLERMRRGEWTVKGVKSEPFFCWETAASLLTLTTNGNFKHIPQRLLVEGLRHSYANPKQVRELFALFQANRYTRVEGINHILSLLRCAKVNRATDLLALSTEALIELAPSLSASNRSKLIVEIGQAGRQLLSPKEFIAFRLGVEQKLQDVSSKELVAMW